MSKERSNIELPFCLLFILIAYYCGGNLLTSEDQGVKTVGFLMGLGGITAHVYAYMRWPPIPKRYR